MKTVGFIRHGYKDKKLAASQKKIIQAYAKKLKLKIDVWSEDKDYWDSSYKTLPFFGSYSSVTLRKGDTLIVSSLSKLGNSLGKVINNIDSLMTRGVNVYSAEEEIELGNFFPSNKKVYQMPDPKADVFKILSNLDKKIATERSTETLKVAKDKGKQLGRPKGRLGKSKLDGKEKEIQDYLHKGVNKANICKIYSVSWPTLDNFIKTRKLSETKALKVALSLMVENNSKFVRGRKRAIENIEYFILSQYGMKKIDKDLGEYELIIKYEDKEGLNRTIEDMISEIHYQADLRHCFVEADVRALDGSDRFW